MVSLFWYAGGTNSRIALNKSIPPAKTIPACYPENSSQNPLYLQTVPRPKIWNKRRCKLGRSGNCPFSIAFNSVYFTVVSEESKWLSKRPLWKSIGRKSLMKNTDCRTHIRISQIVIKLGKSRGITSPL